MILEVVKYGCPILRQKGEQISKITPEIKKLIAYMFETMDERHGVGLAAQQIGKALQLTVIDVSDAKDRPSTLELDGKPAELDVLMPLVLINPEIIHTEGKHTQSEGCLSIPDFRENVTRPNQVTVRAQDVKGTLYEKTGAELLARAFLHETDHLNGKLYISHLSGLKRDLMKRKIKKMMKAGEW